jgi:outer membrane immunogenic protein
MTRRLGLAVASALTMTYISSAIAADISMPVKAPPPQAVYYWTGWYVGGDMGWGWSRDTFSHSPIFGGTGLIVGEPVDAAAQQAVASPALKGNGPSGGLFAGYNWQRESFVLGVEADGSGMNVGKSVSGTFPFPSTLPGGVIGPPTLTFPGFNSFEIDWQATFRGRVGFATNDWLLYGTGGLAVAGVRESQNVGNLVAGGTTTQFASSDTRVGWVAGGGIEKAFGSNWILRVEYLHADYGNATHTTLQTAPAGAFVNLLCAPGATVVAPAGGFTSTACSISNHVTTDLIRAGVSYKFGDPVVAKY